MVGARPHAPRQETVSTVKSISSVVCFFLLRPSSCHVRHSTPVLEALWKELGLSKKKHTTDDMLFTVETVSCLGACGLAPTLMVNEQVYPSMTPEKALALIAELRGKG